MADARPSQNGSRRKTLRIVSFCLKAALVLFPVPTALLTKAPPEIILAAVYATLFTAAGLLALWEIAAGLNDLGEALADQHRPS
jgi:uncharacterized membrane protein